METRPSPPRWRIAIVAAVLFLAFLLLATQLIRWQIVERGLFLPETALASEAARGEKRGHERGIIVDAQGEPLAFDTYRWEIWVEPRHVPTSQAEELAADLVQTLGSELNQTPEELLEILTGEEPGTVTLAKAASEAVGEQIATWDHLAVGARPIPTRFYPQGSLGAHMLGFVNAQPRAYYGVEQYYDDYLWRVETPFFRSSPEVRAAYAQLPQSWQKHLPSASGQDLVLTTDRRIQYAVEEILAEAIGSYQADAGTIIVMEPHTGAILAMASLPAYDPNRYGLTNDRVLADPAISRQYEPGSIFKIVTMAAGIDAGLITADTVLTDTISMEVGGRTIQNSNRRGHGQVTIRETLVRSLNIPTAQVALMLQESLFYQYVKRFGFGQLTEVDLANEGPGTVKVPGDPLWSQSDLATNAFGQGLAVTPMQMATATAVIANGGYLVRPHVVDSMVFRGRVIQADTGFVRRVVRAETTEVMTDLMVDVVDVGVPLAKVPGYAVAGKTGTAQVAIEGGYHPTATIHSFVGFAPADDPSFVAVVKLDSPKTHFWASGTAAPTFARLVKRLVRLLHIPPEQVAKP